ncbi:hypothetical protein DSO57_1004007 [Entomophthora muscae]|uniref:Uncharacterized protein n=1 Tax=Entomophthora muscae TaxID=34485 RepID=A0ACC2SL73_9FUNG|nr:hypothetical protein DSO57_1004007 [Entomophthora muscae]
MLLEPPSLRNAWGGGLSLESNPDPPKTTRVTKSGQEPAHLLNCKTELASYSETCQSPKDNSLDGHQIGANLEPPKIWTYSEVAACLKEVKTKPIFNSANDHQQLPACLPERVVQLNYSGDIVNSGGGTKHYHFYSPEQVLLGSPALKTLSQDSCPASALSANLNPAEIEEAKSHGLCPLPRPIFQIAPGIILSPREPPLDLCTLLNTPPNPAYSEYNLETILIADPLAWTKSTKYIGRKGKRVEILPLLFKDKYNYLPAYFVPMTPPLTSRPDRPLEPTTAAKTTSTQLFGVLYITLTGLVDSVVPNSGPWSLLGQYVSYIIKLAPILWWALPAGLAAPHPKLPNASIYDWLPDTKGLLHLVFQEIKVCSLNFTLKANPRLALNLKSFVIKIFPLCPPGCCPQEPNATLFYLLCLGVLNSITLFVAQYKFLSGFCKFMLQTVPTFLYLLNLNLNALHALVQNLGPLWTRSYRCPCFGGFCQ